MLLVQPASQEAGHHAAMKGYDLAAELTSGIVAAEVLSSHSRCSGPVVNDQLPLL